MTKWYLNSRKNKVGFLVWFKIYLKTRHFLLSALFFFIDPYLSCTHEEATEAFLFWTNPHLLRSWPFSKFSGWRFDFFPRKFAACSKPPSRDNVIIVKRLIQGRNNVTRVWVEPRSCDRGRRKNDAFTLSATLVISISGTEQADKFFQTKSIQKVILLLKKRIKNHWLPMCARDTWILADSFFSLPMFADSIIAGNLWYRNKLIDLAIPWMNS